MNVTFSLYLSKTVSKSVIQQETIFVEKIWISWRKAFWNFVTFKGSIISFISSGTLNFESLTMCLKVGLDNYLLLILKLVYYHFLIWLVHLQSIAKWDIELNNILGPFKVPSFGPFRYEKLYKSLIKTPLCNIFGSIDFCFFLVIIL